MLHPILAAIDPNVKWDYGTMLMHAYIPRLYPLACSNSLQLVRTHPIIISILFHHYKDVKERIEQVEQIEDRVNSKKKRILTIK